MDGCTLDSDLLRLELFCQECRACCTGSKSPFPTMLHVSSLAAETLAVSAIHLALWRRFISSPYRCRRRLECG